LKKIWDVLLNVVLFIPGLILLAKMVWDKAGRDFDSKELAKWKIEQDKKEVERFFREKRILSSTGTEK